MTTLALFGDLDTTVGAIIVMVGVIVVAAVLVAFALMEAFGEHSQNVESRERHGHPH